MSNQLIFATEELRAEIVRLRPVVGAAVEEAMKANGALPLDAFWVLVKTLTFTLEMMGREDIADALILVFQRQLEWPRVPNTDAKIVLPIGEAAYASLDIDAWVEDRFNEDTLAYGRRAVVILGVLIEIVTDVVGQLWGPQKEQYILGILEKASQQSLIKVAKITLPAQGGSN